MYIHNMQQMNAIAWTNNPPYFSVFIRVLCYYNNHLIVLH